MQEEKQKILLVSGASSGMGRAIAVVLARLGIRVNVVAPDLIETDMTEKAPKEQIKQLIPMTCIGKPKEVVSVVVFLCSDAASSMSGKVLSINGGLV